MVVSWALSHFLAQYFYFHNKNVPSVVLILRISSYPRINNYLLQLFFLKYALTLCILQFNFIMMKHISCESTITEFYFNYNNFIFKLGILIIEHFQQFSKFKAKEQPDHVTRFLSYWHFSLCNPISMQNEIPSWNLWN